MEYEIIGDNLPVLICKLQKGERIISEGGAMSWMSPNMKMETISNGGLGKSIGRMFSGEKFFQNRYTSEGENSLIAFGSSFPGSIKVFNISSSNEIIAQKRSFLAAEETVNLSIYFNKKISGGFFGGEGFIMQKLSGNGLAFIEVDGCGVEYNLKEGESIIIDTGHLAAMEGTCSMEVKAVKGVKNIFFGSEGLFNTTVTGPGKVILQSMPLSNIAGVLNSVLPKSE